MGTVTWGDTPRTRGPEGTRARGHEDWRARGPERDSAKVQIGAELLCKSANVRYESIEYGVLSIGGGRTQRGQHRETRDWLGDIHLRVTGLGNRVSGSDLQVRVRVRVLNLTLVQNT